MIPLVEENLKKLASTDMSFKDLYTVISDKFHNEIFAMYIKEGREISVSYDRLAKMVSKAAYAIDRKVERDGSGIIGLYMDNSVEWVVLFWAILKAGFKPLLLNTRQETDVTREIIKDLKPVIVISDNDRVDGCRTYEELTDLIGEIDTSIERSDSKLTDLTEEIDKDIDLWVDNILLVTSGSTRKPKIIVHNGKSICSQIQLTADILERNITLRHNRKLEIRILAFLPFYHIFGLVATMMWFTVFGRTLIFLQDYSPGTIQYTCQRMGVTHFFAVPMVWEMITKKFLVEVEKQGKTKLFERMMKFSNGLQTVFPHIGPGIVRNVFFKSIRKKLLGTDLHFLIAGGGFISKHTLEVMNALGYSLYVGYGLTECGILSVNLSRKAKRRISKSCGPFFTNVEYRINKNSELEIKSGNCFVGMYIDGEYVPNETDYYNTNDIVEMDSYNELVILGRADDLIITENGENMSPEAIEAKLDKDGFESVTMVYAKADGKKQLLLVVETDKGTSGLKQAKSFNELFESVDRLPLAERPAKVITPLGALPRNLKGVDRRKLTEGINNEELFFEECRVPTKEDMERYSSEEFKRILEIVKECFGEVTGTEEEVFDTSDFLLLGGDSMMYVELLERISDKTGIKIGVPDKPIVTPVAFADYIINEKE